MSVVSLALLVLFLIAASPILGAILSESNNRLPMSLSTVIADLEAEGVSELSTACLITSRSVTTKEKQAVLEAMLGKDGDQLTPSTRAVATNQGLALGMAQQLEEVVSTAVACRGLLFYVPSKNDLSRGEGLMDTLAPAMERLLQWQEEQHLSGNDDWEHRSCLVVVCDPSVGVEDTQRKFEAAAKPILATFTALSHNQKVSALDDVFASVLYVTPEKVQSEILNRQQHPYQTTTPGTAMACVAAVVAAESSNPFPISSLNLANVYDSSTTGKTKILTNPQELAAARHLEPAKRNAIEQALKQVRTATNRNTKLVNNFGALCDAVLKQAKENFRGAAHSSQQRKLLHATSIGKDLSNSITLELANEWTDVFEMQLDLLGDACFAQFQQSLGKLRLGPTLANDMSEIAQKSVQAFQRQSQKLLPTKSKILPNAHWARRAKDGKAAFQKRLQEFCRDRLQAAEASGQFKPIPRKGITIGMHWLLPKPFGNDYRQEPWMVHAADNMVYVPRRSTKVTDVTEESVRTGDWRDQIVPSPAGNDMLFLQ